MRLQSVAGPVIHPHKLDLYTRCTFAGMFPIKAAAELTGLSPETLRAWERRHAAVVPHRDDAGRRLYDSDMIERLVRLHRLTGRGHPIRDLAGLDDAGLERLAEEGRQAGLAGLELLPGKLLDAVADYRLDQFDQQLAVAIATLPVPVLVSRVVMPLLRGVGTRWADGPLAIAQEARVRSRVVMPLLREVGTRWADGTLEIAQERLVSSLLRARLLSVLNQHPRGGQARVLFATLPGEPHELGLLGAALHAAAAGMAVLYLGTGLPGEELARAANGLDAAAVAISSIDPGQARVALAGLEALDAALAPGVPVWVGGANAAYLAEALGRARLQAVTDPAALARLSRRAGDRARRRKP